MPMPGGTDPTPVGAVEKYDCKNCPSFMERAEVVRNYKRDLGGPLCAARGIVFGNTDWSVERQTKMRQRVGSSCSIAGQALVQPIPEMITAQVQQPALEAVKAGRQTDSSSVACNNCTWFQPADPARNHGWSLPICAAQGRLLMDDRLGKYATECHTNFGYGRDVRVAGRQGAGAAPLPWYDENYQEHRTPVDIWIAGASGYDPARYETDQEVTPEDIENGIRAWRILHDPEGHGPPVYHPIFDVNFFSEEEQSKIPLGGSDEHPELYVDVDGLIYTLFVTWLEEDDTPCLIGHAGDGKTELLRHAAYLMASPFDRINIWGTTEVDSLTGKMHLRAQDGVSQTVWKNGRLTKRWTRVGVLCVDEFNCGPNEVEELFRPLTDNSKQLVLDENEGERIARNLYTFFGLTMNPAWDPKYIGTNEISDAGGSRLTPIWVEGPPEHVERRIIQDRCALTGYEIPDETLDTVMLIASELRNLIKAGDLPISWGVRPQIKVAVKTRFYRFEKAYNLAIGNRLEPQTRDTIIDVVRRCADQ